VTEHQLKKLEVYFSLQTALRLLAVITLFAGICYSSPLLCVTSSAIAVASIFTKHTA